MNQLKLDPFIKMQNGSRQAFLITETGHSLPGASGTKLGGT